MTNLNELTLSLQDGLKRQLEKSVYDLINLVPMTNKSEGSLEFLLQLKPRSSPPLRRASESSESRSRLQESIYLAKGKVNTPYLLKNADILWQAQEYGLALNIYRTLVATGEPSGLILMRMGKCLELEGKIDAAIHHYRESICYQPSLDAHRSLIVLLIQQDRLQDAAETIERTLALKEVSKEVRFELHKSGGNCWFKTGNYDQAQFHFERALALDPTADEVRSNLGVLCLKRKLLAEAKRHFQDAVASNPQNHLALAGLGNAFYIEGNAANAHEYFQRSLRIEPKNSSALYQLVQCAHEIKQYACAADLLESYIQISPVTPSLLYSLAGLQYHLGRMGEARQTALKIIELQPQHLGGTEILKLIEKYETK